MHEIVRTIGILLETLVLILNDLIVMKKLSARRVLLFLKIHGKRNGVPFNECLALLKHGFTKTQSAFKIVDFFRLINAEEGKNKKQWKVLFQLV